MNETDALQIMQSALWVVVLIASPMVIPAMVVGVFIAFGQALTQIQEQTLTFVPKMLVVFLAMLASASLVGGQLGIFTEQVYGRIESGF